jgi:hypothetical protein
MVYLYTGDGSLSQSPRGIYELGQQVVIRGIFYQRGRILYV